MASNVDGEARVLLGVAPKAPRTMSWLRRFDVEADQEAIRFVHVRKIRLRKVIDVGVARRAPIPPSYVHEAAGSKHVAQAVEVVYGLVIDQPVADDHPTVERPEHASQIVRLSVNFDQRLEVRNGDAKNAAGRKNTAPLTEHLGRFEPVEVFEDMTGIDQARRSVVEGTEVADIAVVIDVGEIGTIDVNETWDMTAATAEMECKSLRHHSMWLRKPGAYGSATTPLRSMPTISWIPSSSCHSGRKPSISLAFLDETR